MLVLLHAISVIEYLSYGRRSVLIFSGTVALLAMITHAFGFLFVSAVLLAVIFWIVVNFGRRGTSAIRGLLSAHLLAFAVFAAWYGFVFFMLRWTTGMAAGLDWVEAPTGFERVFTLLTLFGSADVLRSTTLTAAVWGTLVLTYATISWKQPSIRNSIPLVFAATFLAFFAQNLATWRNSGR